MVVLLETTPKLGTLAQRDRLGRIYRNQNPRPNAYPDGLDPGPGAPAPSLLSPLPGRY